MKIKPPALPDKAWKRQIPFLMKETLFDDEFIEERRKSLESFINKYVEPAEISFYLLNQPNYSFANKLLFLFQKLEFQNTL